MRNHPSACHSKTFDQVEHRINEEIQDGNYVIKEQPPKVVSALAAIEKPDGDVRLIHDFSRPQDYSVNDHAVKEDCQYTKLEDALAYCKPHSWMAKVDLKWAYRSIPIAQNEQCITGLQWTFKGDSSVTYLADTKLPFGARKSPAIYNRITQAIQRIMTQRGYQVCAYLDDFIIIADQKVTCRSGLNALIALLRQLGLRINWNKVVDPCQCIIYLGIEINTVCGTLRLDPGKTKQLVALLKEFAVKKRVSKKQLQSLAGKLSWASHVHQWGKPFISTFFQAISLLNQPNHKFRITSSMHNDILWWINCLHKDINLRLIWDQRPEVTISTDSSSVGAGGFCFNDGDFCYINWILDKPYLANAHINIKELAATVVSLQRWAPAYQGKHIKILTDNFMTTCVINNHYASNSMANKLLKQISALVIKHNIIITAHYLKGSLNDLADAISRLHSTGQVMRLSSLLNDFFGTCHPPYWLPLHMSLSSLQFLSPWFQKQQEVSKNWTRK